MNTSWDIATLQARHQLVADGPEVPQLCSSSSSSFLNRLMAASRTRRRCSSLESLLVVATSRPPRTYSYASLSTAALAGSYMSPLPLSVWVPARWALSNSATSLLSLELSSLNCFDRSAIYFDRKKNYVLTLLSWSPQTLCVSSWHNTLRISL